MDILPTLADLAGVKLPPELVLDGSSITELILGNSSNSTADRPIFFYRGNLLYAVRNVVITSFKGTPHRKSRCICDPKRQRVHFFDFLEFFVFQTVVA
jgi:hypothetical protein